MTVVSIILVLFGAAVVIAGFAVPDREEDKKGYLSDEEVRNAVSREIENSRPKLDGIVEESVSYAIEKSERSMEKLTNEKMTALGEYSETILSEIDKNHKEVLFMYDMLQDKQENLKETVSEASRAQTLARDAAEKAESAAKTAKTAASIAAQSPAAGQAAGQETQVVADLRTASVSPVSPAPVPQTQAQPRSGLQTLEEIRSDIEAESQPPVQTSEEAQPKVQPEEKSVSDAVTAEAVVEQPAEEPKERVLTGEERLKLPPFSDWMEELKNSKKNAGESAGNTAAVSGTEAGTAAVEESEARVGIQGLLLDGGEDSRVDNEKILELHRSGKSNTAIARQLGIGVGEVKLVIDLFEAKP